MLAWQQLLLLLLHRVLTALHVLLWQGMLSLLWLRMSVRALQLLRLRAGRTRQPPPALLGRRLL
jgi:hypothetical protein